MREKTRATRKPDDLCPACKRGLPKLILVTFYDPETRQCCGRTLTHDEWCELKYRRVGDTEN
jgi:hypothetical protein